MEHGCCVLTGVFLELGISGTGEGAVGTCDVSSPCRRGCKSFDSFNAFYHCCDIKVGVKHVRVDERRDKGICGLDGDRSTYHDNVSVCMEYLRKDELTRCGGDESGQYSQETSAGWKRNNWIKPEVLN